VPLSILALLLLAQQFTPAPPEPSAKQKQIDTLVAQIRRLAVSEPAVYGIDTRLKTAEVVTQQYPALAKELLHDAEAELPGIAAPPEQDRMRVRLVRAFAPLDLEESERLTRSFRHLTGPDYVAQAYDQLYLFFEKDPAQARRMITKGLGAGAFRMASASQQLEEWKSKDGQAATVLFAEILGAFPVQSPSSADVLYLLQQTKQALGLSRPLVIQGIDKALSAATSESLRLPADYDKDKDPSVTREGLLREISALLRSIDPELLRQYQDRRKELDLPPPQAAKEPPKEEKKNDDDAPDLSGFTYSEALARARKLDNLLARTGALIDISRREELTAQQRTSVASEALSAAGKLPLSGDRLVATAMISRDFARRNDLANAAFAAQLLSETFAKVCECPAATCKHGDEDFDCLQNVEDFAEYLEEFKIQAEAMSLDNISLQARLLVLKLHALLTAAPAPNRR
jgi:hypothetical protein